MDKVRNLALNVLVDIDKNGAYSNIALKNEFLKHKDFTDRDRHFATILVYGVTDKRLTLDYVISKHSKLKLKKLSVYVLNILRMGVYQIMFMDKIPQSAAVNESVILSKRYAHKAASGFINGVLRSVLKSEIEYPSENDEYLSVKYSYPLWLVRKWINDFGYDFTKDLMKGFLRTPKLSLRANSLKISTDELLKKLTEYNAEIKDGAILCDGFDVSKNRLYTDGYFSVQDISAMNTARVLSPKKGDKVLDMCAAPGGKTTHIAELMENEGEIIAFDMYEHKVELIKKNAKRLGINIINAKVSDATKENKELFNRFNKVLCDVPCSGLGIIGRKPEIKWKENDDFSELCTIQKSILNNASKYLKENGEIVYSTCTLNPLENEGITDKFIEENSDFIKTYEKTYYPHIDLSDGFYICKLTRKNNA